MIIINYLHRYLYIYMHDHIIFHSFSDLTASLSHVIQSMLSLFSFLVVHFISS